VACGANRGDASASLHPMKVYDRVDVHTAAQGRPHNETGGYALKKGRVLAEIAACAERPVQEQVFWQDL